MTDRAVVHKSIYVRMSVCLFVYLCAVYSPLAMQTVTARATIMRRAKVFILKAELKTKEYSYNTDCSLIAPRPLTHCSLIGPRPPPSHSHEDTDSKSQNHEESKSLHIVFISQPDLSRQRCFATIPTASSC